MRGRRGDRERLESSLEDICNTLFAKAPAVLERMKLIANHAVSVPPATAAQLQAGDSV